jgi:hypothetical protein
VAGYRLVFLDSAGGPSRAVELDCDDDSQAIQVVQDHLIHDHMELWQGERLVKRFGGAGA